MITSLIPPTV